MYLTVLTGLYVIRYAAGNRLSSIRLAYWFTLSFLLVFSAFRFEVGCDWFGYFYQFNVFSVWPVERILSEIEPLWVGLFFLQYALTLDYPWINVSSSLVFFVGLHIMARRQPNPLAFLVLLFPVLIINMPMSGIRQAAAIGVMCIAFMAFRDRAVLRYVLWTFAAAAFHSSALIFLLLAPLVSGSYTRTRLFLGAVLALPAAYIIAGGNAADVAVARHIETQSEAAGAPFRLAVIGLSAIYFLVFLREKWERDYPEDFKLAMIGALMMIAVIALLPISSVIADRLAYFLIPIQCMIFARIPYFTWSRQRSLHIVFPYALLFAMFAVWSAFSGLFDQCYRPYQTWLFGYPEMVKAFF